MEWQVYLAKAESNLRVATRAYADGEYDPGVSRAYYAVFHAMIAALLRFTDARPKTSKGRFVWEHDWTMMQNEAYWTLSPTEEAAAQRFIEALRQRYPELAEDAEYGRGHEGAVYVYAHLPEDEDADIEIHETMSEVATDLLVETGVLVLLMRDNLMRAEESVKK